MHHTIRTFVAIKIDACEALRDVLSRLSVLGRPVKTVAVDQLHVTLKFLGDTQQALLGDICSALGQVVGSKQAFDIQLCGLGAFPHLKRPTVIWAGMQNIESLVLIAEELETQFAALGFQHEPRPYRPHLTLARVKSKPPAALGHIVAACQSMEFGTVPISTVALYQSQLFPNGPQYTTLCNANLADSTSIPATD